MRRILTTLALVLVGTATPLRAGNLDLRVGAFFPRADSGAPNDIFRDNSELFTVSSSDWTNAIGGAQYNVALHRFVEVGLSLDYYSRENFTSYRDFVRPDDSEITQTLRYELMPLGVTVRLIPTSRSAKIAPFVGVGGDVIFWKYEEWGDFVDFGSPRRPIDYDSFLSEGADVGFHVTGGVRFALGDDFAVVGEARYMWAEADMGDDFYQNRIDLSGLSVTLGFNIRF
jgi:hypothetical protein